MRRHGQGMALAAGEKNAAVVSGIRMWVEC
jgi:hypothetical protein